ncbi:MAG TPA: transporter substrate-binding domain-containing protein [Paludibacter sp.]
MSKKTKIGFALGLFVLLITIILFVKHSRPQIHDLPDILSSGRLSVLTHSSAMGFSVKGDSVSGFQYEIIKAFADTLGVELVVSEQNDMKDCMTGLKSGDYDIIANFIPITTEWKKEVLFTIPIFSSHQVLVQRIANDSSSSITIRKQNELANDSIYISANSPFKMLLVHLSDDIAAPIHILEIKNQSTEQMVSLVSTGKIKYTICDEQFAQKFKLQYPNIDISLPIGFTQQLAWAVHPQSPKLLQELNDFLEDFIGSSAYWEIYRKYY